MMKLDQIICYWRTRHDWMRWRTYQSFFGLQKRRCRSCGHVQYREQPFRNVWKKR